MVDLNFALNETSYTWKNALLWGNFAGHCRKMKEGTLGHRIVHALIALLELPPIIGQIVSIFEKLLMDCLHKVKPQALGKTHVDLIILGGTIVTMDGERRVVKKGGIAVDKGKIVQISTRKEINETYEASQTVEAEGKAVIPGLINGHAHIPMSLFRGVADDLDLHDWLTNHIFPAEAKNVNEAFVRAGTRLGIAEMILGGTTTVVDMYYFEDAVADEIAKAGMRGIAGQTLIDFPSPDCKTFEKGMEAVEKLVIKWKGHPLITPAIAPHAPYTVSEEHLRQVAEFSKRTGVPIIIHLSETESEVKNLRGKKGMNPVSYLKNLGVLDNHVIAAHMVFPQEGEIDLMKEANVGVVHCPHSNMKLASGAAPVPEMLIKDLSLGLGTDGSASNNALSLWEEMDTAAKLHKGTTLDPKVVPAEEAFAMATIRGARALRMEKEIGSLEVGKKADIVLVALDALHQIPSYNIYSTLVYATKASDVSTVIIEGKVVLLDRKLLTLNEDQIRKETTQFRIQISKSLNHDSND